MKSLEQFFHFCIVCWSIAGIGAINSALNFPPDEHTAVVTLSHDPKIDDEAIIHALNSKAFYIACLGSKKTHLSRLKRLKQKGFNANELNRLIGPAGLSINSKTPSEIAVSIMAQLIQMKKQ